MKTNPLICRFNIRLNIFLASIFFVSQLFAQTVTKKEIVKEVASSPNDVIEISNSSNDIIINTWKENKVKVVMNCKIESKDSLETEKLLKTIENGEIKKSDGKISMDFGYLGFKTGSTQLVETALPPVYHKTKIKTDEGTKITVKTFDIDITVYIPETNELNLKNSFSDITLGNLQNKATLTLSSSHLKGNDFKELELTGSFSKIKFNNAEKAKVTLSSSEFEANKINELNVKSSFSEVEAEECGTATVASSSDSYELEKINKISGLASFSEFKIGQLAQSLDLKTSSGEVEVGNVKNNFEQIKISGSFSSVDLKMKDNASYQFDCTSSFSDVSLPKNKNNVKHTSDEFENNKTFSGIIGENQNTTSKISITCSSCDVDVK